MAIDLSPPKRRGSDANLLPMINVVFLLLIFFLITAKLAPPEPFAVTPPEAQAGAEASAELTLHLDAAGRLGFRELTSDDAGTDAPLLAALAAERGPGCAGADCAEAPRLLLRADAAAPVARLAALLPALAMAGFAGVELIVSEAAP